MVLAQRLAQRSAWAHNRALRLSPPRRNRCATQGGAPTADKRVHRRIGNGRQFGAEARRRKVRGRMSFVTYANPAEFHFTVTQGRVFEPSMNVTVPVGVPLPGAIASSVTV